MGPQKMRKLLERTGLLARPTWATPFVVIALIALSLALQASEPFWVVLLTAVNAAVFAMLDITLALRRRRQQA